MSTDHLLPSYVPGLAREEEIREQFAERPLADLSRVRLVGIAGKKRRGKNTAAEALVPFGFQVWGFADELKKAALDLDPVIDSNLRLRELVDEFGWEKAKDFHEVRRILQVLGTEVIRNRDHDFWVTAMQRRWEEGLYPPIVVADVRFDNEAEWIHLHGGFVLQIDRPDWIDDFDAHESEAGVSPHMVDAVIVNDGTVKYLHRKVVDTLVRLSHSS